MKLLIAVKAKSITVKLKTALLLNASLCIGPLTFIIEVLRLVASVEYSFCNQLVSCYLTLLSKCSQHVELLRTRPSILSTASVIWKKS